MPKWKKDETEFTVNLLFTEVRGYWATIPKPIVEHLGNPDKITFLKKTKGRVEVQAEKKESA